MNNIHCSINLLYIVHWFSTFYIEITCLMFPFCVQKNDEDESSSDGLDGDDVTAANIHHAQASSLEYIIWSGMQMNLRVLSAGRTVHLPLNASNPYSRSDVRLQPLGRVLQIGEAWESRQPNPTAGRTLGVVKLASQRWYLKVLARGGSCVYEAFWSLMAWQHQDLRLKLILEAINTRQHILG